MLFGYLWYDVGDPVLLLHTVASSALSLRSRLRRHPFRLWIHAPGVMRPSLITSRFGRSPSAPEHREYRLLPLFTPRLSTLRRFLTCFAFQDSFCQFTTATLPPLSLSHSASARSEKPCSSCLRTTAAALPSASSPSDPVPLPAHSLRSEVLWIRHLVQNMPSNHHCHHNGLARSRRHLAALSREGAAVPGYVDTYSVGSWRFGKPDECLGGL